MVSVHRRKFISNAVCWLGACIIAGHSNASRLLATRELLELPEPAPGEGDKPSFELFLRLSQLACGRLDLDPDVARKIYSAFDGEPWWRKHAETAYRQLISALRASDTELTVADLIAMDTLDGGEKWFVSHVLTTWYLGVYYHPDRENVRVTYAKALMHETLADYRPVPGFSDRAVGFWQQRPQVSERLNVQGR